MSADPIAVRVTNLTKIYRLWKSPRERLIFPLKGIWNSFLPSSWKRENEQAKGYREFHALHNISFEIRKGEAWGFIGVNGSGKSTLLKIISGNLRPSEGTVEVDGKVAILNYGSGVSGDFTGRDNIYVKGALLGLTQKQLNERYKEIVEFADIGDFIDQPVKTYSSGMSARLGFAIMMHVDADIMISDEALAVGDAFFVQKAMRHIRSFLKRGTFLFVSHSAMDVMSLCSHAVWLDHGRIVQMGTAKQVCQSYMDAVVRKNSERLQNEGIEGLAKENTDSKKDIAVKIKKEDLGIKEKLLVRTKTKHISVSGKDLAALKKHYLPHSEHNKLLASRLPRVEIYEPASSTMDSIIASGAVGGGKIFSVTITDDKGAALSSVLGGEIVRLTIRAIAEKAIKRPILGFQLKNNLGLPLVGENTHEVMGEHDFSLQPGEVISAQFRFMMPLIAVGEYMILAAFHDGVQISSAAIDVIHEALLLHSITSGDRHGMVGVPMLAIDITRDKVSAFNNS
ncbi:MAG: ABC transporter ATP-binding protein [Candidatus Omnitrophota bacterium]